MLSTRVSCAIMAFLCGHFYLVCSSKGDQALIDDLERNVLAARKSISSGRFEVDRNLTQVGQPVVRERTVTWIDVNGNRVRQDRYRNGGREVLAFGSQWFTSFSAEPGQFELRERRKWPGISMVPVDRVDRTGKPRQVHNPLLLMLAPAPYGRSFTYSPQFIIAGQNREQLRVRSSNVADRTSHTVSFVREEKPGHILEYEYDVIPELGYSVVRLSAKTLKTKDNRSVFLAAEADVAMVAPSIWFPTTVRMKQTVNGQLTLEENLIVKVTDVNASFPESVFDPSGMDLPTGAFVVRTADGREESFIWEQTRLRPATQRDYAEMSIPAVSVAASSRRKLLLWLSVAFALAAIVVFAAYSRLSRRRLQST